MTQKEKLFYYLDRINNSTELKDEIYWKCGLEIWKPNELQDDLESLMEGGCKQNYELIPFASDGDGGVCVLVDNQYVSMIDSEGGAGYIAASVDDFINILLWYKYIPITKKVFDGFEEFIEDYQRDEYGSNTSELINDFLQSEHLDLDNRMVYEKFLKGVSLTPAFIIEPMDEEYEISENLFRFDEAEFNEKIRCTGFAANEGDVDMVFEDAFTDLQSEFVSLCMEYTGGCVDKIYIYIYQDASQKMFNAIFVKGDRVIPAGNFADDEASDEFLSIGTKDISKLVELCDMYQQKCPNEYKLEFDVATHKFDASYRYDEGLLVISARSDVIRLVPPLIVKKEHVDELMEKLKKVCST